MKEEGHAMQRFKDDTTKDGLSHSFATDHVSDDVLIMALAEGAIWAMEVLYSRYCRIFYALAYRMVADHQVAEELLQDAFFAIWRYATSYSPQAGSGRSWLLSIVRHRVIDYLRSLRRSTPGKNVRWDEAVREEAMTVPDVWDEVWQEAKRGHVREALRHIPAEQRMVIELAYFQGLTHAEIAAGYLIPLGTVKARMRLGLMHLKHELARLGIAESE